MKRNYFIMYEPKAQVNYLYIFMLYGIAQYSVERRKHDYIYYSSMKDLSNKIANKYGDRALSYSTLARLVEDDRYKDYISKEANFILLNNDFQKYGKLDGKPFIIVSNKEADKLIEIGDKQLASYYCYIKYYCGLSQKIGQKQNFTAKQYLSAVGLSINNHNNLSNVSRYNKILQEKGLIKIEKYRDDQGNERNKYSVLSI